LSQRPTVCILTAGKGTRMGALGLKLNKALHPIGGKAIISRITEKLRIGKSIRPRLRCTARFGHSCAARSRFDGAQ